jgi:acyl carrier protein
VGRIQKSSRGGYSMSDLRDVIIMQTVVNVLQTDFSVKKELFPLADLKLDLGLDSLDIIEFINELCNQFPELMSLKDQDIDELLRTGKVKTIDDVVMLIAKMLKKEA